MPPSGKAPQEQPPWPNINEAYRKLHYLITMTDGTEHATYWDRRAQLEAVASGITSPAGSQDAVSAGRARAEILRLDREYAEEQERSRRGFKREMSAEADAREASRQKFDETLAQRQMDHASKLARDQLDTAQAAARAARWAAGAAVLAALGAIGQVLS